MNFNRQIWEHLVEWKLRKKHKPIVLRGARQVGKTTIVKHFATTFRHSILLNLEKSHDVGFFNDYDDVQTLVEALFLSHNIPSTQKGETLLFIDEIQESTRAIQQLRYLYEDIPDLYVIAAGSLLEFALREIELFPVGRIKYLYLHPLNFLEYLRAIGQKSAEQQLQHIPVRTVAHKTLLDLFHKYAILGGMPEVVHTYVEEGNMLGLSRVYESIWETYKSDVGKYASNESERRVIRHIMNTAHLHLDKRIKFQNFGNSNYRSREVGEAMRNLDDAKVIRQIYPTTDVKVPLSPNVKKSPRLQFLDTGLVNYALGIQPQMLAMSDLNTMSKGALVPHLITQEMVSLGAINNHKPNFWVRGKKQSSAEVDLVYTYQDKVIPIEVKSGSAGKLRSLHQFMEATDHPYAIRIYAGKFAVEKTKTPGGVSFLLMNLPYYLGTQLPQYIRHFVEEYKL